MPWPVSTVMKLKQEFVQRYLVGVFTMAELCAAYEISRKTGYKWINRFQATGLDGLRDLRAERTERPFIFGQDIWEAVRGLRMAHPTYGPRKLFHLLVDSCPERRWPSVSRIKRFLRDTGLSQQRVVRGKIMRERLPLREYTAPNSIWCMDFKGYFKTADNLRCDTLTMMDGYSRYLLTCTPAQGLSFKAVKPMLEKTFREFGKPETIRTDNGTPFGSNGFRGLSLMSVWLLKHGIWPEKITPGNPSENGRLERLHRTLEEDAIAGAKLKLAKYQQHFEQFRHTYNTTRPHEALGYKTPAQVYQPSSRLYQPNGMVAPDYPEDHELLRVNGKGYVKLAGRHIYLTEALANETIGMGPKHELGRPLVFLGYPLGYLEQHLIRTRAPKEKKVLPL